MKPNLNPEALTRALEAFDEARCAALDAEVDRRIAAGIPVDESLFEDDGPDPIGIDWAWAKPSPELTPTIPGPPAVVPPVEKRGQYRFASPVAAAVIAASLLMALGATLFFGGRSSEMAFKLTTLDQRTRGPNSVVLLSVENRSATKGFITVVGLAGARSPIHTEERGKYLQALPGQEVQVRLPPEFDPLTAAVVIFTTVPAADAVRKALDTAVLPADPTAAKEEIDQALREYGHRGAATELVKLSP